jgi:TolB protein
VDDLFPVQPVQPPGPARRRLLAAVTIVVLAAFVVVAGLEGSGYVARSDPAPTFQAANPPLATARLAIVASDGGLNVFDSGPMVQYPANGATFGFPAWSPDHTRIAVIRTEPAGVSLDVYRPPAPGGSHQVDSTPPTVVYRSREEPPFYAYWAPDGNSLAFLTTEPDGIALRRAPADASRPDITIRRGAPMYWQWIDPARLLVHSGGEAAEAFAGAVGLDGTRDETMHLDAGAYRAPTLSADGRSVAFATTGADGSRSVVVGAPDGSVRHDVAVFGPAAFEFDPVGHLLAFVGAAAAGASSDIPVGPLRAIDPASGDVRTVLDGSIVAFFWAPDGKTIAAIGIPASGGTHTASIRRDRATLARAQLGAIRTWAGAAEPTLALFLVDPTTGAVRSQWPVRLSDLFISQVLPYFDQYALSHRFWAPDGRSIALPVVNDRGASMITSFPADGSDPVELVEGQFAAWSP